MKRLKSLFRPNELGVWQFSLAEALVATTLVAAMFSCFAMRSIVATVVLGLGGGYVIAHWGKRANRGLPFFFGWGMVAVALLAVLTACTHESRSHRPATVSSVFRVTDVATGKPIRGATVRIRDLQFHPHFDLQHITPQLAPGEPDIRGQTDPSGNVPLEFVSILSFTGNHFNRQFRLRMFPPLLVEISAKGYTPVIKLLAECLGCEVIFYGDKLPVLETEILLEPLPPPVDE